jgi:carboxypeptidase PM20D1
MFQQYNNKGSKVMRKTLLSMLMIVSAIVAFMLYRASFTFEDLQLTAKTQSQPLSFDKSAVLTRLSQAIQIQTISYDEPTQFNAEAFMQFHQYIKDSFPLVHQHARKTVVNQHSLLLHLPGVDNTLKPVLLMSHMDVVPVDSNTRDQWSHDPFSGALVNGVIWGRGTMDDKGGLMALLEAVELMLSNNTRPARDLYLAFGHDEEIGGKNGAAKIAQHLLDKGINFEFVLDEGGAITEGLIQGIDHPVALIGVAEKGFVNVNLTVNSSGGHASQPPKQTAVGILSQAIVNLQQNPFPASLAFTQMTYDAIGIKAPFFNRLAMANLWLLEPIVKNALMSQPKLAASLHTTMAPTMLQGSSKSNILPTQASGVVNVRIFPGETYDTVKAYFAKVIDDSRVQISLSMKNNPSAVSAIDNNNYKLIAQTIRNIDNNILVAPYLVQGGTDSKYFYSLTDNVYRFLMIRANKTTLSRLHGIDEQISEKEYFDTIDFYSRILNNLN